MADRCCSKSGPCDIAGVSEHLSNPFHHHAPGTAYSREAHGISPPSPLSWQADLQLTARGLPGTGQVCSSADFSSGDSSGRNVR